MLTDAHDTGLAAGQPAPRLRAGWVGEVRPLLTLAAPMILLQLAQMAIGATDVLMMGWLGQDALAAGALGAHAHHALYLFGLGVCVSVSALASQALGAHRRREVRRIVRHGLYVAAIITAPLALILAFFGPIARLLGQPDDMVATAAPYVWIMAAGLLPSLGFVVLRSFCGALDRPTVPMTVMILAIGANALLNYVLMFGHFGLPRLELIGAGIASVVVEWAMFLGLLVFVVRDRRFRRYTILVRFWRVEWHRIRQILQVGLPIGAAILMEAAMFTAAIFLMGVIGKASVAAHQIAILCGAITFNIPLGLAQATTIRVGHAAGRRNRPRIRSIGIAGHVLSGAFMTAMAVMFIAIPETLAGLFLDASVEENRPVIDLAVTFLFVAALFQVVDGAQVISQNCLRGLKDTRTPMLIAIAGYWGIGFPVCALLGLATDLDGIGVWIGLALGLAVAAVALTVRFVRETSPERIGHWFALVDRS